MKYQKYFGKPRKPRLFVIRRVHGESMSPCLAASQLVFGLRRYQNLHPGDVVIFEHQGVEKIKRISDRRQKLLFMRGDNPDHSTDSRSFGWISDNHVIAKVIWPRTTTQKTNARY